MGIPPFSTKPESQSELDRKAEGAAQKVRHAAEINSCDPRSEGEKIDTDVEVFEAHAELERPEHYKGHPLPQGRSGLDTTSPTQSWYVLSVILETRNPGAHVANTAVIPCDSVSLRLANRLGTNSSRTSTLDLAPARIIAAGVECAAIRVLRWMPNLTHLLFEDTRTGEKMEFCVKLGNLTGSTAGFIVR
jgi:hypothetical protein